MKLKTPMRSRRNRGFTLIELMVVVLILAVLAALVVPKIVGSGDKAKYQAAQSEISTYKSMLDHFHLDVGRYPTTEEGLEALHAAPSGTEGKWGPQPYTDKTTFLDPWGNPYVYEADGNSDYVLKTYGQDGQEGGDGFNADISTADQ
jgi:general secretion pathway protein G